MPNYVVNKIKIKGKKEEIDKLLSFIKADDGFCIDFNKITPMPKWVYHGNLSRKEEEKYGEENCWYNWSITNWGTKWNAFEADNSYYFKYHSQKMKIQYFLKQLGAEFQN